MCGRLVERAATMGHCLGNYCKSFRLRCVRRSRSAVGSWGGCQWRGERGGWALSALLMAKVIVDLASRTQGTTRKWQDCVYWCLDSSERLRTHGERYHSLWRFHEASGRKALAAKKPESSAPGVVDNSGHNRLPSTVLSPSTVRDHPRRPLPLALPPDRPEARQAATCNRQVTPAAASHQPATGKRNASRCVTVNAVIAKP